MMNNGVKIFLALFLLLILTGCSSTEKKQNIIKKKPLAIQTEARSGDTYEIVQLSNGTYIYHDKQYPGLD